MPVIQNKRPGFAAFIAYCLLTCDSRHYGRAMAFIHQGKASRANAELAALQTVQQQLLE